METLKINDKVLINYGIIKNVEATVNNIDMDIDGVQPWIWLRDVNCNKIKDKNGKLYIQNIPTCVPAIWATKK